MKARKLLSLLIAAALSVSTLLGGCADNSQVSDGSQDSSVSSTPAESDSSAENTKDKTDKVPEGLGGDNSGKTAVEIAKEMGIGLNLGNTMEAYEATNCEKSTYTWIPKVGSNTPQDYETCWGATVTTQEIIDGMKNEGFNTVRVPVFWGNMMEDDGTYTINKDYIRRVREIVEYCLKDDLYVVINCHHFDEFIIRRNDLEDCERIFNTLWTQIAEYFKDYGDKLIFEGFNEYLGGQRFDESGVLKDRPDDEAYELTNALNQTFVDAVRATGGNNDDRMLIVSGYWTNIDKTTGDKFVMPTDTADDRLMVSVHYIDNACYWSNSIGNQNWLDYIKDQCDKLKKKFTDNNIPVFVGETTSIYPQSNMAGDSKYDSSSACLEELLTWATDYGFIPVLWDTDNNAYSRTECRMKNLADSKVIKKIAEKIANG